MTTLRRTAEHTLFRLVYLIGTPQKDHQQRKQHPSKESVIRHPTVPLRHPTQILGPLGYYEDIQGQPSVEWDRICSSSTGWEGVDSQAVPSIDQDTPNHGLEPSKNVWRGKREISY